MEDNPDDGNRVEQRVRPFSPTAHLEAKLLRAYRVIGGCFALVCFLQIGLNIVLRNDLHWSLSSDFKNESQATHQQELWLKNSSDLIEERARCEKELDDLIGWKSFQSSKYFFSFEEKTWDEAREDCRQRGSDLAIIKSPEEQEFLTSKIAQAWIGLTDRVKEGEWMWVDGTPLSGSDELWMEGEPNNADGGEDCGKAFENQWNDQPCNLRFRWICEQGS